MYACLKLNLRTAIIKVYSVLTLLGSGSRNFYLQRDIKFCCWIAESIVIMFL